MSFSFTTDIRSVTDLKRHTRQLLQQTCKSGRPIVITVGGRPNAVLLNAKVFEDRMKLNVLARLLAEGEDDLAAGRSLPFGEFLTEFKRAKKIQG